MRPERPPEPAGIPSWAIPAIVIALVLAAGIAVGGYEIGTHANGHPAATQTPTPTVTPRPTPTVAPRTAGPSPTASTTSTPAVTVTPTASSGNVLTQEQAVIRQHNYVPDRYAWVSAGQRGRLYGWSATCANSGDGYCQRVFFFLGNTLLGTDTKTASRQIIGVAPGGSGTIWVRYANYRASDPLCCPSLKPVRISYTWTGSALTASGTPPGH